MASTQVVNVTVDELSKYGFKFKGRYVNYSKQLSESDKAKVVPGVSFDAELYVADSGKEYLNKIVGSVSIDTKVVKQETKPTKTAFPVTPSAVMVGMSKEDWAAKDKRISRQGCIQAAIQATGGDFDEAVKLADKMLEFVNK